MTAEEHIVQIVIVGAHGQVAMLLHPLLRAQGHQVRGIIRNPDHADAVREAGAEPVVCDLEAQHDISDAVGLADAVVFAAGAGPGSGAPRKQTMDRDGALKLIDASRRNGIQRYVMVSAMHAEQPRGDEVFQAYLRAKAEADQALRRSELDYTIIRPGRLTNEPGSSRIRVARELPRAEIPRADVAAVLAHILDMPQAARRQFDVTAGVQPIADAITAALAEPAG
jgi:uncharacterized protein YbjT (DUF2867 family)